MSSPRGPNPLWHRHLRFWRSDPHDDLDVEFDFHVQSRVDEYRAAGMNPDEAHAEARRRVGDLRRVREECLRIDYQSARRRSMVELVRGLVTDIRVALRSLRRDRALAIAAVACLALGIGANTAIFSVVDAVLFRPLAFRQPDRLVLVGEGLPMFGDESFGTISTPDAVDYQALDGSVFTSSAAFAGDVATLTGAGEPERVVGIRASASLFRVLGVRRCRPARDVAARAARGAS